MVNRDTKEMVGVECQVCHGEAFKLVEREVTMVVKCCPRCAAKVDLEQEEETTQDALKAMEKSERKQRLRELSFEWANKLHGQKVIVFWDENTHPVFCSPESDHHIQGTAYRTTNESGGWGNVKVVIDPTEHGRITVGCRYTLFCEIAQNDMFFASAPLPPQCWAVKCKHQNPIIDGQRFGLLLNSEDGSYYTLVSWGCRKSIIMDGV